MSQETHEFTNELIHESSPYLLQHAHNPVNWHPWNEKTLEKAKRENKLLIISIGYSACHWCHVMEHESFEDESVAALMNEHFLPIKVDREERPDVDHIYMTACNLISGRGGWPLNAFALPDGRPIWAGTYFPKKEWSELLNQFINLNSSTPDKLIETAKRLTSGVNSYGELDLIPASTNLEKNDLKKVVQKMNAQIDQDKGGRKGAPKFPMPNNYEFLLKYGHMVDDQEVLHSVFLTLDKMANGGIYDQIGGGFARYSVDSEWKVPHFEKMLYDNGQLIGLYSMAYRLKPNPLYEKVVIQSLDYIEREMTSLEGGFYSSLDADSEGVEGKYYIWSEEELAEELDDELLKIAKLYYTTNPSGNWEHSNILHITQSTENLSKQLDLTQKELNNKVSQINELLLAARTKRVKPGLDDKILTGWNALMISGYVEAYKTFGHKKHLRAALKNANYIKSNQLHKDFRLNRSIKEGKSSINAFLDDYVALTKSFIDLYEVTFDEDWLTIAMGLCDYVIKHFKNEKNGMFYLTSNLDAPLVAKSIETTDNVIPGTNSSLARNLFRLGQMTYNKEYLAISQQMMANIIPSIADANTPAFYSNWAQLWLDQIISPYEIVAIGKDADKVVKELNKKFLSNSIILAAEDEKSSLPLLENKFVKGKTLIYVCENKVCQLPVESVKEALELISFDSK